MKHPDATDCPGSEPSAVTRRGVLQAGAIAPAIGVALINPAQSHDIALTSSKQGRPTITITTTINDVSAVIEIDPRTSLLDLLRERMALTGAKKGCDHGQCGACTVHVDARRVASCLTMAAKIDNRNVTTIEGISDGRILHPMQQAFIDHDALQCGYCTPGQIMAAIACVHEGHATSREEIREYLSGNICRCGAYPGIVAAVEQAARVMKET